ncbi:MAG: hypothetical protein RIQ60_1914 [Pseudomonadota bacterium]|jgi:hypothetical protein
MAKTNKAGAAGEAAALPGAALVQCAETLNRDIGRAHHATEYEVLALVQAAENLADCHRVLHAIDVHAERAPAFQTELRNTCAGFASPLLGVDEVIPFEIIQNLLRVANGLLMANAVRLEDASVQAGRMVRMSKGEQA